MLCAVHGAITKFVQFTKWSWMTKNLMQTIRIRNMQNFDSSVQIYRAGIEMARGGVCSLWGLKFWSQSWICIRFVKTKLINIYFVFSSPQLWRLWDFFCSSCLSQAPLLAATMPIGGICWTKRQTRGRLVTSAGKQNTSPTFGEVPTAGTGMTGSDGWRRPGAAAQPPRTPPRQTPTAWMPIGGFPWTSEWRFLSLDLFFQRSGSNELCNAPLFLWLSFISPNSGFQLWPETNLATESCSW